ncbi:hypothetical protein HMI54_009458 [Coelomomyces lativittatus]|nr:hypothetical protein HMI54_009458 [Coelomomyces lativittatus]
MSRVKSSLFFFLDLPLTTPFSATLLPNDVLPATCPLLQLLPFLDHANRSISIIYLLKNLVYHQTFLDYFLKPLILPVLHRLTPLSFWDSDEFMDHLVYEWTPHFETNGQHQLELLEVVVISTATKVGRNMLRELGGYQVLRTYHTQCQEPLALRWVEMAVDHLMREEANEELEFVEGEGENN